MQSPRKRSLASTLGLAMLCLVVAGASRPGSSGSIDIVSLAPEAGSVVNRESIITAELRYSIEKFKRGKNRYQISIKFQDRSSRARTFSEPPGDDMNLEKPSGTITLSYPLRLIWDNSSLRKPPVVYFFLHERTGRNESVVLNTTDQIRYSVRE